MENDRRATGWIDGLESAVDKNPVEDMISLEMLL